MLTVRASWAGRSFKGSFGPGDRNPLDPVPVDFASLAYAQHSVIGSGGYVPEDVRTVTDITESGKHDLKSIVTRRGPSLFSKSECKVKQMKVVCRARANRHPLRRATHQETSAQTGRDCRGITATERTVLGCLEKPRGTSREASGSLSSSRDRVSCKGFS